MKGFTKDNKFHPIRDTEGVRKSRDQTGKTEGVKIRKGRWDSQQDLYVSEMVGKMKGIDWANRQKRFSGSKERAIKSAEKSYNDMISMGIPEEMARVQLKKDLREINEEYSEMIIK